MRTRHSKVTRMHKLTNRYIRLTVGLLLSVVYSLSYGNDDMQDTMSGLAELMTTGAPSDVGAPLETPMAQDEVPINTVPKVSEPLKLEPQVISAEGHQKTEDKPPKVVQDIEQMRQPLGGKKDAQGIKGTKKETFIEQEEKGKIALTGANHNKSCELCLGPIQVAREQKANGSMQLTVKATIIDKKGRLVLGSPIIFYASGEATPPVYDTQTNINGEALFIFTTFHQENTKVEIEIDKVKHHLAIN